MTRAFPLSPPGAHRLVKLIETPRSANRTLEEKRAAATAHAASLTWTGAPATSRAPPSSSSTTSSPADLSSSTSHADCGHQVPPMSADSSSPASPGAGDPAAPGVAKLPRALPNLKPTAGRMRRERLLVYNHLWDRPSGKRSARGGGAVQALLGE